MLISRFAIWNFAPRPATALLAPVFVEASRGAFFIRSVAALGVTAIEFPARRVLGIEIRTAMPFGFAAIRRIGEIWSAAFVMAFSARASAPVSAGAACVIESAISAARPSGVARGLSAIGGFGSAVPMRMSALLFAEGPRGFGARTAGSASAVMGSARGGFHTPGLAVIGLRAYA